MLESLAHPVRGTSVTGKIPIMTPPTTPIPQSPVSPESLAIEALECAREYYAVQLARHGELDRLLEKPSEKVS